MDAGLRSSRWSLAGAAWDLHRAAAARWVQLAALSTGEQQALALSRSAEWVCRLWPHSADPKGRRMLAGENGPVLVSWSQDGDLLSAVLVAPERLRAAWRAAAAEPGIHAAVTDLDGSVLLGTVNARTRRFARSQAIQGLPAILTLSPDDASAAETGGAIRRRLLWVGFAVLATVLLAGSYFILRAMAREREAARLQSDFVSTVSHEFRTPLTSLRQLSEMLVQGRVANDAERQQAYELMFHASGRLQRMVESLLDFGRMESASFRYRFEDLDVPSLVDGVVADFRRQVAPRAGIAATHADGLPGVRADREAIAVAVWNLLDNAVKYSPGSPTIRVETRPEEDGVAIAVRDDGPGIPREEHDRIFDKFVRGRAARDSNVKGTGIGLTMSRQIVRAHGGDIRLASEPAKGSTFTIILPAERRA